MNTLRPLQLLSSRILLGLPGGPSSIPGARYATTEAVTAASPPAPPPAVSGTAGATETTDDAAKKPGARRSRGIPPPGHGERLWVHHHIMANHTIYSLTPEMRSTKAYRQFAYTGKKLVPGKLRKDYWRPLLVVEFGAGKGDVGRSTYQKLRELQKRHALEWDDGALLRMDRRARGEALNDQRGNTVADLAAVLAGRGKGNRVVVPPQEEEEQQQAAGLRGKKNKSRQQQQQSKGKKEEAREVTGVVEVEVMNPGAEQAGKLKLHQATVYWANEQDKYYAEAWTDNVTHVVGLPEKPAVAEAEAEAEAAGAEQVAEAAHAE